MDNNNNNNKYPKVYILIPVSILIILYISTHSNNIPFYNNNINPHFNYYSSSQLKSLSLLKHQQSHLIHLLNHSTSYSSFDFLNSALLTQISLNKQIQLAIQNPGFNHNVTGFIGCPKVVYKDSDTKKIDWKPIKNRFLFAICVSGQMSNHLICLEKHMFFAALLNRVLVIPSSKVDYQFDRVLDIEHINKCLGRNVVVTFDKFAEIRKNESLRINKFVCYFSLPNPCFLDYDHVKKLKSLGVSMNGLETAWVEDVRSPRKRTVGEIVEKFSYEDDVVAIGDMFFADMEGDMAMQPGGPIAHKCRALIEPSKLIVQTAQRFVQTFLGERFVALHFRRHGFLKFCNAKQPSCFFPIPQAADCISRVVEKADAPVIYLSTDAAESETNLLQSLIVSNGKVVPLFKRPARNFAEKWDALLYRSGIEGDPQVEAMLDKTISAMSTAFIGSSGSTFTEDILRLRKDGGSASVCDEYLCQGEIPNYIANNE